MTEAKIDRKGDSDFQITGDMTFESVPQLLTDSKAVFGDVEDLNLDLAEVKQVDSAGLALLLEWISQAKAKDAKISLKGIPESLREIARLCQVDSALDAFVEKKAEQERS